MKKRLLSLAICLGLLPMLCAGTSLYIQSTNAPEHQPHTLSKMIPPADPTKYKDVLDGKDWQNPFVMVQRDEFALMVHANSINEWKRIPLDKLEDEILKLPPSAWPYGRVVALAEVGIQGAHDSEAIHRNRVKAESIIRGLGAKANLWPSA